MSDPKVNEGWIEWSGGGNPVGNARVETRHASGDEYVGAEAWRGSQWHETFWTWSDDDPHRIIAYRLVTAAEDRGDGNEAAEQRSLIERLREKGYTRSMCDTLEPLNKDGPEAADEIERLNALVSRLEETIRADGEARGQQIAWRPGVPPTDAGVIYGHSWSPFRWHPYSPKSDQYRSGLTGRWQTMGEYGGWTNVKPPNEWATQAEIEARSRLSGGGE